MKIIDNYRKIVHSCSVVVLLIFLYSCNSTSNIVGYMDCNRDTIVLSQDMPFLEQVKECNKYYIIKDNFDLLNQTVIIPDKSVLIFVGGKLKNGCLKGDFSIIADSSCVFEKIDLRSFNTHPFNIKWITGDDRVLTEETLKSLPATTVFFDNKDYYLDEQVDLSDVNYVDYQGLHLIHSESIKMYCPKVCGGLGDVEKEDCLNTCNWISAREISLSERLSDSLSGYLILLRTANKTKRDYRPSGLLGLPSLYKGLTTVIESISDERVSIKNSIESFPIKCEYCVASPDVVKHSSIVYSTWEVRKPKHIVLRNCVFRSTKKNVGISLGGKDIVIDNSSFYSDLGTSCILSICETHKALVKNCVVAGAWNGGNQYTNYGIQINGSSEVLIDSCSFYNNRRSVDFSGQYETCYSIVSNCYVKNDTIIDNTGSALGGHSTSFCNSYINNIIEGKFQVGIECRGEKEVIQNNIVNAYCNGAVFSSSIATVIKNNNVTISKWGVSNNAVFVGRDYGFETYTAIEDNIFNVRENFLFNYDKNNSKMIVLNNTIHFLPLKSFHLVHVAPDGFSGVFLNNKIDSQMGVRIYDIPQ